MIPDFKTFIRESVWADIHKRANGEQIRKEDDVDLLDIYDFCTYLNEKYNFFDRNLKPNPAKVDDFKIKGVIKSSAINIPIFANNKHVFYLIYDNEFDSLSMADISDFAPELYSNLKKEFDVRVIESDFGRNIRIYSDGKITNSFIINVIEYIINNPLPEDSKYKMCVKRAVNESIWGDIHKRSSGNQVRKEDATNIDSIKPVDIGASVLWADRDLEKQGEYLFAFDEIPPINSNEWRLPTKEEIDELELKFFGEAVKVYQSEHSYSLQYIKSNMKITLEDGSLIYRDGDVELVFEARGSVFPGYTKVDYVGRFYDGWGDDNNVEEGYENCAHSYHFGEDSFKPGLCRKNGKNCVRLVKDK